MKSAVGKKLERRNYTLIELLVVVSIIAILASILLPSLRRAKEYALDIACKNNERNLGHAFIMFAGDHDDHMPGNSATSATYYSGEEEWKGCWLFGSHQKPSNVFDTGNYAPQCGTIYPYVGKNREIYRCMALPVSIIDSGEGSNGYFDYAMMLSLTGAKMSKVSIICRIMEEGSTTNVWQDGLSTPVLMEESPSLNINNGHVEGGHGNVDAAALTHFSGCNYIALDGSVHRLHLAGGMRVNAKSWQAKAPSGNWVSLGAEPSHEWGWWNSQ